MGNADSERVKDRSMSGRRKGQIAVLAFLIVTLLLLVGAIRAKADLWTEVKLFALFGVALIIALAAFLTGEEHTFLWTATGGKYHVGESDES